MTIRTNAPTEYVGLAEVVPDELRVEVKIDDLNIHHWRGELHAVAMRAQLRRARIVEIQLLDGDHEGERANCVVVDDDGWPAVIGQTPFHS
jgi:hypothetical protein